MSELVRLLAFLQSAPGLLLVAAVALVGVTLALRARRAPLAPVASSSCSSPPPSPPPPPPVPLPAPPPPRPSSLSQVLERLSASADGRRSGAAEASPGADGLYDPALLAEAERTLAQDPKDLQVLEWLAFMYLTNDDVERALDGYRRLVLEAPRQAPHLYYLGSAFFKANLVPEAMACWRRALEAAPADSLRRRIEVGLASARKLTARWGKMGFAPTVADAVAATLLRECSSPEAEIVVELDAEDEHPPAVPSAEPAAAAEPVAAVAPEEDTALCAAFQDLFRAPGSPLLLGSRSPLALPPPSPLWPPGLLESLAIRGASPDVRRFAFDRLLALRPGDPGFGRHDRFAERLASGPEDERCAAALLVARSSGAGTFELVSAALHGEGALRGRLAAWLVARWPDRALPLLRDRWAAAERAEERAAVVEELLTMDAPAPAAATAPLLITAAGSPTELARALSACPTPPGPELVAAAAGALASFAQCSDGCPPAPFRVLERRLRLGQLTEDLERLGPTRSSLREALRAAAARYDAPAGPVSATLAQLLGDAQDRGDLARFFALLTEEAAGNLEQSVPELAQAKGKAARQGLMAPQVLAGLALLRTLARRWPASGGTAPVAEPLMRLALAAFGLVSFGQPWYESIAARAATPEGLRALLTSPRDDVPREPLAGLEPTYLLGLLLDGPPPPTPPVRERLAALLEAHASPALLGWALDELAEAGCGPSHPGELPQAAAQAALRLLEKNAASLGVLLPLLLDGGAPGRLAPALILLPRVAVHASLDALEGHATDLSAREPERWLAALETLLPPTLLEEQAALTGEPGERAARALAALERAREVASESARLEAEENGRPNTPGDATTPSSYAWEQCGGDGPRRG